VPGTARDLGGDVHFAERGASVRTLIARIFDYSLDGVVATEDTSFFQFCRDLPDDEALEDHTRAFYEQADLHLMGRKLYQDAAQYFPGADDHPYADAMNAARKVVFSHTITSAGWANTSVATGDLPAEVEKLTLDGDGYIVVHGGIGFLRSLIHADLIDEYRISLFPYLAGTGTRLFADLAQPAELELLSATAFNGGVTELAFRRPR
jgi:dihydrofolate reductase